jgi:hypothetical protein
MQDSAGSIRNVLAYLRDMIEYCRGEHRDDLRWDYEEAVDLIRSKIYGNLPPRKAIAGYPGYQPNTPPVPLVASGPRIQERDKPLRKIVGRAIKPYRSWTVSYEELECGHQFLPLVGDKTPAKRRRCAHCAREIQAKKKPASVKRPNSKAVSA